MAKLEPVETAPEAGPDVVQVASTAVAEAATAATSALTDQVSDHVEQLSTDFQMDPAYTTSDQNQNAVKSGTASKRSKDAMQTLKTVVIISGVVVALVGAILAVSKKAKKVT